MKHRSPQALFHALAVTKLLVAEGYDLFPLGVNSKTPRDKGWSLHDYRGTDWPAWLRSGGNIGVKPRRCDLFIDVDPKGGGLVSFDALKWDFGLDGAFDPYPIVHTGRGNGGFHLYMRVPEEHRYRWHLKGYPGIDFQTLGHYVVAPGSIHPETGGLYSMEGPLLAFPAECRRMAPQALLDALRKEPRVATPHGNNGRLTRYEIAQLLAFLNPADFATGGKFPKEHNIEWLDIGMACHHGTDGEAREEWLDWSARDERYGDAAREMNAARWDSFESARDEKVTFKTLLQAVSYAGHRKFIAGNLHRLDFQGADDEEKDWRTAHLEEDWGDPSPEPDTSDWDDPEPDY